jgi:hypothetical protein
MPISKIYRAIETIALSEFSDVAIGAQILRLPTGDPLKLRLDIVDGPLLDVYISLTGRYSYHWERRMTPAEDIYRYDNAPHERWRSLAGFPAHFHDGAESHVVASELASEPDQAIRQVLGFVRKKLASRVEGSV